MHSLDSSDNDDALPAEAAGGPAADPAQQDPVLVAVGGLVGALRRFSAHTDELIAACDQAAGLRETGASYRKIADNGGPFIGEAAGPLRDLLDAVGEYRRTQARALYEEGLTMAQLGRLLGVSRQRVAVLLGEKSEKPGKQEKEDPGGS